MADIGFYNSKLTKLAKDPKFRAKVKQNPSSLIAELNQLALSGVNIEIVENTHDTMMFVIPYMNENLNAEQMSLISAGVPKKSTLASAGTAACVSTVSSVATELGNVFSTLLTASSVSCGACASTYSTMNNSPR